MESFSFHEKKQKSIPSYLVPLIEENDIGIVSNEIATNEKITLTKNIDNNHEEQVVRSLATMTTNDNNNDTFQQQQQHNPVQLNNNNWFKSTKGYLHVLFVFLPLLIWNSIRLLLFVLILLIPGFIRIGWYYFISSKRISRRYQTISCRQTLDIYGATVVSSDHIDDNSEIDSTTTNHHRSSSHVTTPPATTCNNTTTNKKPVLIFAPGGAWLIGYKMWGVFTARALEPFGILIIVCDYRNYPWGTVPDMVDDISNAITWSIENCESFGGDPDRVILLGQSAGGHIMSSALLRQALQLVPCTFIKRPTSSVSSTDHQSLQNDESQYDILRPISKAQHEEKVQPSTTTPPLPKTISGLVSLSSPYDVNIMSKSFKRYGLSKDLVYRIFGGKIDDYDPQALIQNYTTRIQNINDDDNSNQLQQQVHHLSLPPIAIFHGTCDKAVPYQGSEDFARLLRSQLSISDVTLKFYEGWSHTDPILEGLLISDHRFHIDLCNLIYQWTGYNPRFDVNHPSCQRLTPDIIVQIARWLNPF